MIRNILVIGANSAIAKAAARMIATKEGGRISLLARNEEQLKNLGKDLMVRGASEIQTLPFDATNSTTTLSVLDTAIKWLGTVDLVLVAHGVLPDQNRCERDSTYLLETLQINLYSPILILNHLLPFFEKQGKGHIAVISSVAGDRGRKSNYVYGAAKGGLSLYLQGLRGRLFSSNVHVMTVKPGFVDTPMTAEFKKGALWAKPEGIATGILKGIKKRRDVIYLPCFWWGIMFIIKSIPEKIFKRLSI